MDDGKTTALQLAKDAVLALRRGGWDWVLFRDFQFRTHIMPSDMQSACRLQGKLQSMMLEIMDHLRLIPLHPLQVRFVSGGTIPKDGRVGEYDSWNHRINVFMRNGFVPEQLETVLCHECTHYFMEFHGLNDWSDPPLNERRTDVMACLIGFRKMMAQGCRLAGSHYEGDRCTGRPFRIGYILPEECDQVIWYLLRVRSGRCDTESVRTRLRGHIAGAKSMMEQAAAMRAVKQDIPRRLSPRALARVKSTLHSMESGEMDGRLRQCGQAVSGSADMLGRADDTVLAICADLYCVLAAYR